MIPNAALHSQAELSTERGRVIRLSDATPVRVDAIRTLAEAVQRPGSALYRPPGRHVERPFDAQYWACWVVAFLFPAMMAYLWVTA